MSALASGHHWVAVLELLHGMKPADITPDVISYNTSLSSCQPGQWRAARRFFDAMPKSYILPDVITYSTMISVCEKAWQWTDALHLLHSMPSDLKADLPCFSALISSLEKGFQWALALQTLGNISKASLLDTVACNACLAAVEKVTEWEVALQLYHWCLAHGIAVDEVMDGSLLSSVSRGTRWRLALQQFKILSARRKPTLWGLEDQKAFQRKAHGISLFGDNGPTAFSVSGQVSHWRQEFEKAQAQREEFRMALEEKDRELQEERRRNSELLAEARRQETGNEGAVFAQRVLQFQETTRAASPAAKGAERASRPATAAQPSRMTTREAPREAPRDGSKPGPVGLLLCFGAPVRPSRCPAVRQRRVTLATRAGALDAQGVGWCIKGFMWQSSVPPNLVTFGAAVSACEKAGEWTKALQLMEALESTRLHGDVVLYSAAISSCEKGTQWLQALALLQWMSSAQCLPNRVSFSAAISACEKAWQWQWALHLFRAMPAAGLAPQAISFSATISACEKGEQWPFALQLLREMSSAQLAYDVFCCSATISACEKGSQWLTALDLLELMQRQQVSPNLISYTAAIAACARAQQWRYALHLFDAAGRGALPSRTARGASPTERVRLKMAPAENSGTYTSERPVRPSWAAPLQELHEKAPVATPAVRETPKTPQTVPRVMPPRREASPGGASGGRSGSPPRPIMSPGRVPVFAMSPRAAGALAWPDGGSPSSPEAPRAKADHERHRSGGSRSVSLGRRGPVPQNYCVEVISDVQASKLTGRPVEEERPRKCPPSPALLLCPTEVIDDHEERKRISAFWGCLLGAAAPDEIGDGTLWVAAELSDVSASSDEHQIRERLQRCLGLHESQA
eukprot:g22815.t1